MVTTKCVVKKGRSVENALYAVPSVVEGYAIRCVLFNTIIIPNVWASHNINMSHMYIALIQLHVIYLNQHPPVYMVTWLTSFTVIARSCGLQSGMYMKVPSFELLSVLKLLKIL